MQASESYSLRSAICSGQCKALQPTTWWGCYLCCHLCDPTHLHRLSGSGISGKLFQPCASEELLLLYYLSNTQI